MEASELRIGNWALKALKSGQGRKLKAQIGPEDIVRIYNNTGSVNYEPIPLTEEWLVRFGFEKDDTGVDIFDQDYYKWYQKEFPIIGVLCQSSDNLYLFDENTDTLRISFVHQLQNLYFALTGTELPTV